MLKSNTKMVLLKFYLLLWAILCVLVFIYFPGRASVLYGSSFSDLSSFFPKLGKIDFRNFSYNLIVSFFEMIIFSIACFLTGSFVISLLQKNVNQISTPTAAWLALHGTAIVTGQGLFSLILLALAMVAKLTPTNVTLVLVFGAVIGIVPSVHFYSRKLQWDKFKIIDSTTGKINQSLTWLIVCILFFSLMYSSARLSYDSVAMYFSDAKITAMTNQVEFFPNESYIVSSFHAGINYAGLIQVFGDQTARMYSWLSGIVILIFVLALGLEFGLSRRANLILLTLLLTSTAFLDLMGDGKIDLACFAPALAAVYWMKINELKKSKIIYLIIGFLVGLAMVARPYNIFLLSIFIVLYYFQSAFRHRKEMSGQFFHFAVRPFIYIGIGIACLMIYHLFANWVILGTPVAFLTNFTKVNSSGWQWAFDPNQIWTIRLLYPLTVTFLNTPQSLGNISPLFVAFIPGLLIKEIRKEITIPWDLRIILWAAIVTLSLWVVIFFTVFEIRYVLFLWILLFIPAALIIEKILSMYDLYFRLIIKMLLIILPVFIAFRVLYISLDSYSPMDISGNPQCFDSIYCDYLKPINKVAGFGDRVLTLSAYRYYLRNDLFACSTSHVEYISLHKLSHVSDNEFWVEVYKEGYKYIAYEKNYTVRHLYMDFVPDPNNTPVWLKLKPIFGKPGDPMVAYQIILNNPPLLPQKKCSKSEYGIWQILPGVDVKN